MTCLHNHEQILEFLRKIFLKVFQIYQNYLCALTYALYMYVLHTWIFVFSSVCFLVFHFQLQLWLENPKIQLTCENALPQIEAPYNSEYAFYILYLHWVISMCRGKSDLDLAFWTVVNVHFRIWWHKPYLGVPSKNLPFCSIIYFIFRGCIWV